MSLTVKEILDAVMAESGLQTLDQYFGGNDPTLTALLNRSARNFSQYEYSGLRTDDTITMTTALSYDVPTDLRYIVANTMQMQDQERYVKFPTSTSEWYYLKSRTISTGIDYKFRFQNGKLFVENPQPGEVLQYEYLSENVVLTSGSATGDKPRFTADTDTWLLDDDLLILDLKWRYKNEKGIEGFEMDYKAFKEYEKKHRGKEAGSGTLYMSGGGDWVNPEPYTDLYL